MQTRKLRTVLAVLVGVVAVGTLAAGLLWPRLETWAAGYHQKQVTRALAEWSRAYSSLSSSNEAVGAAGIVDYISHFYVPGPGYQGPPAVEATLARQRQESITVIVGALEAFTGLHYGTNTQQWKQWADSQKANSGGISEPDGAANRSQPIPLGTNSISLPAGSGR